MDTDHQQSLSAQTKAGGLQTVSILTKTSKSGVRYFYAGAHTFIEAHGGGYAMVANTSLFLGDAHRFYSDIDADVACDALNERGIGGARWYRRTYHRAYETDEGGQS